MEIISLIIVLIVIMLIFKGIKMRALVTNLVMRKSVKALTEGTKSGTNYEYWINNSVVIFNITGCYVFDYRKGV